MQSSGQTWQMMIDKRFGKILLELIFNLLKELSKEAIVC